MKVLTIALNDLKMEFSERTTLVFFLLIPLAFTFAIAQGLGGSGGSSGGPDLYPVAVVDEDGSMLAEQVIQSLQKTPDLQAALLSADQAAAALEDGEALAVLTLPAGFGEALAKGQDVPVRLERASDELEARAAAQAVENGLARVDSAVQAALAAVNERRRFQDFPDAEAEQAFFDDRLDAALRTLQNPPASLRMTQSESAAGSADEIDAATQASSGQLVTWTLFTLLGVSDMFVGERLLGTLRRLIASPTRPSTVLLGKLVGRLAMGWTQMAILILFGGLVLGVNWGRSPLALLVVAVSFSLAAVAFGVMIGAFAKTRGQAGGLTTLCALLLAALGGAWWPLEITPQVYQALVKALPTTWAMFGFNEVILRGADVRAVLPEAGMMLVFAALFFIISIPRLRFA